MKIAAAILVASTIVSCTEGPVQIGPDLTPVEHNLGSCNIASWAPGQPTLCETPCVVKPKASDGSCIASNPAAAGTINCTDTFSGPLSGGKAGCCAADTDGETVRFWDCE